MSDQENNTPSKEDIDATLLVMFGSGILDILKEAQETLIDGGAFPTKESFQQKGNEVAKQIDDFLTSLQIPKGLAVCSLVITALNIYLFCLDPEEYALWRERAVELIRENGSSGAGDKPYLVN